MAADYEAFRRAFRRLGKVQLSIDDAGAGYASLRHILELGPSWAKLDISMVRGIDADPLRQSLVAGLAHFAGRSGEQLIAEGVERKEEADVLLELGVELLRAISSAGPSQEPEAPRRPRATSRFGISAGLLKRR